MKNVLILISSIALFLFSCKKENSSAPVSVAKTYDVSFNVKGFNLSTGPFITNAIGQKPKISSVDTLKNSIDVLYYWVYNSGHTTARAITQTSSDANFGTTSMKLPTGTYTVSVIGGKTGLRPLDINNPNGVYGDLYVQDFYYGYIVSFPDTFFQQFTINVASANSTYSCTLNRIIAQLEVDIQDAVPAGTTSIQASFPDSYGFNILTAKVDTTLEHSNSMQLNNLVAGSTGNKMYGFSLSNGSPFTVTITAGTYKKVITGVTCKPNQITVLTGNLFGGQNGNSGFHIKYNPKWQPIPITVGF